MLIEQKRLTTTNAATFYTFKKRTDVRAIHVCNTSSSDATYSIFYDKNSGGFSVSNALYYEITLKANSTDILEYGSGSFVAANQKNRLGVQAGTASAITITMHGEII